MANNSIVMLEASIATACSLFDSITASTENETLTVAINDVRQDTFHERLPRELFYEILDHLVSANVVVSQSSHPMILHRYMQAVSLTCKAWRDHIVKKHSDRVHRIGMAPSRLPDPARAFHYPTSFFASRISRLDVIVPDSDLENITPIGALTPERKRTTQTTASYFQRVNFDDRLAGQTLARCEISFPAARHVSFTFASDCQASIISSLWVRDLEGFHGLKIVYNKRDMRGKPFLRYKSFEFCNCTSDFGT